MVLFREVRSTKSRPWELAGISCVDWLSIGDLSIINAYMYYITKEERPGKFIQSKSLEIEFQAFTLSILQYFPRTYYSIKMKFVEEKDLKIYSFF